MWSIFIILVFLPLHHHPGPQPPRGSIPRVQALSSAGPFVPLAELISRPLNLNLPILTVNLLTMPAPPAPPPPVEEVPAPSSALDGSQSAQSISGRTKSRNTASKAEGKV